MQILSMDHDGRSQVSRSLSRLLGRQSNDDIDRSGLYHLPHFLPPSRSSSSYLFFFPREKELIDLCVLVDLVISCITLERSDLAANISVLTFSCLWSIDSRMFFPPPFFLFKICVFTLALQARMDTDALEFHEKREKHIFPWVFQPLLHAVACCCDLDYCAREGENSNNGNRGGYCFTVQNFAYSCNQS